MPPARRAAVRFRERSELLDFLLEVSAATAATLDLDQLLANVAEIVQKVLPHDLFAILLYNDKRQDLRIRYGVGHREEVVSNLSIKLGEGITLSLIHICLYPMRAHPPILPLPHRSHRHHRVVNTGYSLISPSNTRASSRD